MPPAAISEHFLRSNDRLTLRTVGAAEVPTLGVGSGTNHLRRVLDTLAAISPATERRDTGDRAVRGVDPNALCLVLSPLIDPTMVTLAHTLAARGMTVVVVDTFPEHLVADPTNVYQALAWRIRLLSRDAEVHASGCAASPSCRGADPGHSTRCCATSPGARRPRGWRGGDRGLVAASRSHGTGCRRRRRPTGAVSGCAAPCTSAPGPSGR